MAEYIEYNGNFSGSQIDTLLAKIQSSQVFTTEEKTKLASLVNYDDTEVKEDISDIETSLNSHKSDKANPHEVTKTQVGLGNVDNTSDANKPISTATQTALNNKVDKVTGKGLSSNDFTDSEKAQIEKNTEGIGAVANRGSKNIVNIQKPTTVTRTSYTTLANGGVELSCINAQWTAYAIADIGMEAGKPYVIKFLLDESSGTNDFYFFLRETNSSGVNLATKNYADTTGEYVSEFTPTTEVAWLGIYLNNSATARTATAKVRCAIMPKALYDADSTYVPYAPTNRELYEMILSLQAGT